MKRQYDTLVEALNGLRTEGYTTDFNLDRNCLICRTSSRNYGSQDFMVDAFYRFEGMNDPGDSNIVYAIQTTDGTKGVLLTAYGMYAEEVDPELMARLQMH